MGVKSYSIDGNKVDTVFKKTKEYIDKIRKIKYLYLLNYKHIDILNIVVHINDDLNYRSLKEIFGRKNVQ